MGTDKVEMVAFRISFLSRSGKTQIREIQAFRRSARDLDQTNSQKAFKVGDMVKVTLELKGKEKNEKIYQVDESYLVEKI